VPISLLVFSYLSWLDNWSSNFHSTKVRWPHDSHSIPNLHLQGIHHLLGEPWPCASNEFRQTPPTIVQRIKALFHQSSSLVCWKRSSLWTISYFSLAYSSFSWAISSSLLVRKRLVPTRVSPSCLDTCSSRGSSSKFSSLSLVRVECNTFLRKEDRSAEESHWSSSETLSFLP